MKVLVATYDDQHAEPGDYCFTVEGELVTPIAPECCDGDRCGCNRGFPGLASSRATTTAKVVDHPAFGDLELWRAVTDSLERDGWLEGLTPTEREELVRLHVDTIRQVGAAFPAGTIVRRNGDLLRAA